MRGLGKIHFSVSLIYLNSEVSTLYEIELICRLNFKLLDLEINYVIFRYYPYFRTQESNRVFVKRKFSNPFIFATCSVNLWYFKLRIFNPTKFIVLKYLRSTTLSCKGIGIRKLIMQIFDNYTLTENIIAWTKLNQLLANE